MITDEPAHKTAYAPQVLKPIKVRDIIPVDRLGYGELMRVGAGLGGALGGAFGSALTTAATEQGVTPAPIDLVLTRSPDRGVVASSERRVVALGTQAFLVRQGIIPRPAELQATARLEAEGRQVFYVVLLDRSHCLGLLGFAPLDV